MEYKTKINEAEGYYNNKQYLESAQTYSQAFTIKDVATDRFNAACSWALLNNLDSSFAQLSIAVHKGEYSDLEHFESDRDLRSLHSDKRWSLLVPVIKQNNLKKREKLDLPLIAELNSINQDDQQLRKELSQIEEKFGPDSEEVKNHWVKISENDEKNLIKIENILETRGWLGRDIIGRGGSTTIFLVIQHASLEIQEKYLPMMRNAVAIGNAHGSQLALLEDRIAMRNDKPQIYGSQITTNMETGKKYIHPIIDPENVDKRRRSVGLGELEIYVRNFNLQWKIEDHKSMTEQMIKNGELIIVE